MKFVAACSILTRAGRLYSTDMELADLPVRHPDMREIEIGQEIGPSDVGGEDFQSLIASDAVELAGSGAARVLAQIGAKRRAAKAAKKEKNK